MTKYKPREKGKCPDCGKILAIKKGVGPYAQGRGELFDHKYQGKWHIGEIPTEQAITKAEGGNHGE